MFLYSILIYPIIMNYKINIHVYFIINYCVLQVFCFLLEK